jgi:hypothetical protein
VIDADPRHPQKPISPEQERDPFPLEGRNLAVDEQILHLLLPFHPQRLEAVPRPEGAKGQREIEVVEIQESHIGRLFVDDFPLPGLGFETDGPADLGDLHISRPEDGVLERG